MKMTVSDAASAARGQWPRILTALGVKVVKNRHTACPMCGGNAQLHEKRTKFFCKLGATLFVWRGCSSGVAPSK